MAGFIVKKTSGVYPSKQKKQKKMGNNRKEMEKNRTKSGSEFPGG